MKSEKIYTVIDIQNRNWNWKNIDTSSDQLTTHKQNVFTQNHFRILVILELKSIVENIFKV